MNKSIHISRRIILVFLVLSTVLFCIPSDVFASDPVVSIVVLPFVNESGSEDYDWLSLGLQDSATIDLWYMDTLRTYTISDVIEKTINNLYALSTLTMDKRLRVGAIMRVDKLWLGRFNITPEGKVLLALKVADMRSKNISDEIVSTCEINEVPSVLSAMVIKQLAQQGVAVSGKQKEMIRSNKTTSFSAFKANAKGYDIQQSLVNLTSKERQSYYRDWENYLLGAVRQDSAYAEAWNNLGWAYYSLNSMGKAGKAFGRALQLKPFLVDANAGMGTVFISRGDFEKAVMHFDRALGINPNLHWVRSYKVEAQVGLSDPSVIPILLDQAEHGEKQLRLKAIKQLGSLKNNVPLRQLGELALSPDDDIRKAAVSAISDSGSAEAALLLEGAIRGDSSDFNVIKHLAVINSAAAAPYFVKTLEDSRSTHREAAAIKLGKYKLKQGIPALSEAVKAHDKLSILALTALWRINDPAVLPAIREAMKDERVNVRGKAVVLLGRMEDKESIDALWDIASNDKKSKLRLRALMSLAYMSDKKAIDELVNIVKGKDRRSSRYAINMVLAKPDKFKGTKLDFVLEKYGKNSRK
jgi:HEAT repeat protein